MINEEQQIETGVHKLLRSLGIKEFVDRMPWVKMPILVQGRCPLGRYVLCVDVAVKTKASKSMVAQCFKVRFENGKQVDGDDDGQWTEEKCFTLADDPLGKLKDWLKPLVARAKSGEG